MLVRVAVDLIGVLVTSVQIGIQGTAEPPSPALGDLDAVDLNNVVMFDAPPEGQDTPPLQINDKLPISVIAELSCGTNTQAESHLFEMDLRNKNDQCSQDKHTDSAAPRPTCPTTYWTQDQGTSPRLVLPGWDQPEHIPGTAGGWKHIDAVFADQGKGSKRASGKLPGSYLDRYAISHNEFSAYLSI